MRKPATDKAVLASQKTNSDTSLNIATPADKTNLFGLSSLGDHHTDAKNMAALLQNMQSGMSTYHSVYDALERKYGPEFCSFFMEEVNR